MRTLRWCTGKQRRQELEFFGNGGTVHDPGRLLESREVPEVLLLARLGAGMQRPTPSAAGNMDRARIPQACMVQRVLL